VIIDTPRCNVTADFNSKFHFKSQMATTVDLSSRLASPSHNIPWTAIRSERKYHDCHMDPTLIGATLDFQAVLDLSTYMVPAPWSSYFHPCIS
jgi:hypothetical protein